MLGLDECMSFGAAGLQPQSGASKGFRCPGSVVGMLQLRAEGLGV